MKKVLSVGGINSAIRSMVRQIRTYHEDTLTFVILLKGGIFVGSDVLKHFMGYSPVDYYERNLIIGFLGLSSYHNKTETSSKIKITYPLDLPKEDISGKNVWVIDDVFDSGLTLMKAKRIVKSKGAKSVRTAVLVRKMRPRIKSWISEEDLPDVIGFEYPSDGFLVGFGMGEGEKYRGLNQLYELEPHEIRPEA